MRLGFGLVTCQRYPGDPRSDADLYEEAIELAVDCERLGLDSVWLSEHHFLDDAYMPSLLPVAAAIAARTSRIDIGTALVLAPLHDPIRLAEDAATVDAISRGRFVLGLGMGWREEEFDGFGVPLSERRRRLVGAVTALRQAFGDGLVTGDEALPLPGVSVTPKPARPGGPPIWIGASADVAIRRAGRIADGYLGTQMSADELRRRVALLRDELERSGRDPGAFTVSMYLPLFAWEDGDAWELVREHVRYVFWKYSDMAGARGRTGPPPSPPPAAAAELERLRAGTLAGPPAQIAERIASYRDAAGGDLHFVARAYWPGLEPSVQRESLRLFAEVVAPLLRRA